MSDSTTPSPNPPEEPPNNSNLVFDPEIQGQVAAVVAWCTANGLRADWIPSTEVFVDTETIRFREVVPVPGDEDAEHPQAVPDPSRGPHGEKVGPWQTVPLKVHPREFGLRVDEAVTAP